MNFAQNDNQKMIAQVCRDFAEKEIRPYIMEWDEAQYFPRDLFRKMGELGLLGVYIPQEYGGSGFSYFEYVTAIVEITKVCSSIGLSMAAHNSLCSGHIYYHGTKEQKEKYLPKLASGESLGAWGLTEPNTGSDAMRMKCTAKKVDGGWVINGTKCWMSGVAQADWYIVFAKTGDPSSRLHSSITGFIVERKWDGVSVPRTDKKMGVRGVDTGELHLQDVVVPKENVLGEVGGFRLVMEGLNAMRPIVAARGLGLAEGALMYATEYVKNRPAFGRTIADFQGIQWEIAKCATEIEAARLLTYRAACLADQGKFTKAYVPQLSMSKYYATEMAVKASGLAVQLLGAAGYMEEHPTELWYRDARQLTIVEGTSQVQLGLIGKGVLAGDLWWD